MPFKKGDDPNRNKGGRPKRSKNGTSLPEMARGFTEEALAFWVEKMRDPKADDMIRARCTENIIKYGWGQAPQRIDLTKTVDIQQNIKVDTTEIPLEIRMKLLDLMEQAPIEGQIIEVPLIDNKTDDKVSQGDDGN